MKGAWSLRGFAVAHLRRHVHMHTHSALTHVGPIDLLEQTLLWAIMLFTSHGKSISLLSLLANTRKGNLLSLSVMLPVSTECEIGNLCFRLSVMLLSHITLNLREERKKTSKEKIIQHLFLLFLTYNWPKEDLVEQEVHTAFQMMF